MRKKTAVVTENTKPIAVWLKPGSRESLALLAATRKAAIKQSIKPRTILGILDDAILRLASEVRSGTRVRFIPFPPSGGTRMSLRISERGYQVAQQAANKADVRMADFIRTAIAHYLQRHVSEIRGFANYPKTRA